MTEYRIIPAAGPSEWLKPRADPRAYPYPVETTKECRLCSAIEVRRNDARAGAVERPAGAEHELGAGFSAWTDQAERATAAYDIAKTDGLAIQRITAELEEHLVARIAVARLREDAKDDRSMN